MKYKVIGKNDIFNVRDCVFENRGIENINEYINLDDSCLIPFGKLDNISEAVDTYLKHIHSPDSHTTIVVDPDCDGICASAELYNYTKTNFPDANIDYVMHTGKQHGLSDDVVIPQNTTLIILPDGGTNDTDQCKYYNEQGIDIIILDHHIQDKDNPYAIIVNNQCSADYPNKNLCGAGIVYKFLQAVDEAEWIEDADNYLDLVAVGNIGDIMDMRSYETKRLVTRGLSHIKNKAIKGFIKAQEYSIKNHLNIHTVTFCIAPLINAMCRCGDMDEKSILFRAFIETEEEFDYKKRGQTKTIQETIYDRAARLCKNTKAKQDKAVQKALPELKDWIEKRKVYEHPIMFVKADSLSSSFTGLVAIKLADYYNKPCLVLRKRANGNYGGSARNNNYSPIEQLKNTLNETEMFEFCQGHEGAFGFEIQANKIADTINLCKERFGNLDFETINVDFELGFEDFDIRFIRDIDNLSDYYGTGIKEPRIIITNIILQKNQGVIMGKDNSTWKFITDDNIAFIKFKNGENDKVLAWLNSNDNSEMIINAFCEVGFNDYGGVLTPQAQIKEYEVI